MGKRTADSDACHADFQRDEAIEERLMQRPTYDELVSMLRQVCEAGRGYLDKPEGVEAVLSARYRARDLLARLDRFP